MFFVGQEYYVPIDKSHNICYYVVVVKNKKLYILLMFIHCSAISIFCAIGALGVASLLYGVTGEFSPGLIALVFCLVFIIYRTGGMIDLLFEEK